MVMFLPLEAEPVAERGDSSDGNMGPRRVVDDKAIHVIVVVDKSSLDMPSPTSTESSLNETMPKRARGQNGAFGATFLRSPSGDMIPASRKSEKPPLAAREHKGAVRTGAPCCAGTACATAGRAARPTSRPRPSSTRRCTR
ncbi:unnamed protein product [Prorocentrum cordatum]|uniref:Uncharacterized protein n=1 Tax=Prorocentrum cordatum TaxID=2364126 RepID=A0ABN9W8A4_9DINO|nr:unnamed protein product [Polarella glacialis]